MSGDNDEIIFVWLEAPDRKEATIYLSENEKQPLRTCTAFHYIVIFYGLMLPTYTDQHYPIFLSF